MLAFHLNRTDIPSKHMLGSLPFTLIKNSHHTEGEFCIPDNYLYRRPFPLFDLVRERKGEASEETSLNWAPWEFKSGIRKSLPSVDWLPKEPIEGFQRWYEPDEVSDSIHYNPRHDPLRISNSQRPILDTLDQAFQQNIVPIKNVLMITLESTRKDVFPMTKSSHLHDTILSTHDSSARDEITELLANISHISELITGESSGFERHNIPTGTWRDLPSAFGGINVQGAITSATYTLKNLLASHCGVGPLPVDFGQEATHEVYQPCLPHVLGLFNTQKNPLNNQGAKDFRSQIWDTAYVQSVSDKFDSQWKITEKMGFSKVVNRDVLRDTKSKFYPPTEPDSNYFGYPETQVKPYIRDIIETARDNDRRFFISHLTSTTHHDWSLPAAFGPKSHYMGHLGWQDHEDINSYLNTIKYADGWLGEIMDLLEETAVINETLVVVTGDHGFAFREDDASYSNYNGAHITNFRIPLVFYHPKLPRLHLKTEVTSQSILPTILDLLVSSNSLDMLDRTAASHLLGQYEGQSLVREYQTLHRGRQAWHISLLAPGGTFIAISSAAHSWRLIMPLCHTSMFRFTDLEDNENEEAKLEDWSLEKLLAAVSVAHGSEAARWLMEAKEVGTWWFWETRRLWKFGGETRYNHPGWNETIDISHD
ncbi:hypothetical protein BP6252_03992 [Coleophoma cylindrospora]|uniref:Sulfatase N-terminal domain-containing protein n=1 Tax=Coleophoma cylindrospora TaxID=1849047 RepID=A0A3D8RZS8_9HELO|nr:hypothetical protein BP6252_03992 [Coleophoma cylindrospora]